MNVNDDSIELLQEYLDTSRTHALCQQISLINDRLWGISLRECSISNDKNYEKLMNAIKKCKSLRYLNLNLSVANTFDRISLLTGVLGCLTYLDTLCLHSCQLRDEGFKLIYYSIINLKHFRSLDIGDNQLTDNSVMYIRELIHRREQSKGLYELILSANPKITPKGWTKILVAVAASASLRYFHLDYNTLDDSCGYLILAILSANHSLQVLDLEHTGLTNKTAKLLLFLIKNYRLSVKTLNLLKNPIDDEYQQEIYRYLPNEYDFDTSMANGFRRADAYTKPPERPSRKNSRSGSQIFDIRLKDQSKLKQFLSNANKLNSERMDESTRLERTKALERDYIEMVKLDEALEKQQQFQNYEKQQKQIGFKNNSEFTSLPGRRDDEYDQDESGEILNPYDDLKYKTHNILPFNIKSY